MHVLFPVVSIWPIFYKNMNSTTRENTVEIIVKFIRNIYIFAVGWFSRIILESCQFLALRAAHESSVNLLLLVNQILHWKQKSWEGTGSHIQISAWEGLPAARTDFIATPSLPVNFRTVREGNRFQQNLIQYTVALLPHIWYGSL